jgi:hypothetical protein
LVFVRSELGESHAVDEVAGLNHLIIHILQKSIFIVLEVSENQDEITCTHSLHCLVLKTSCIIRVSLGCFILLHCESNVVVLQSFLETVLQSKTESFKIQCEKAKHEGPTEMLAPSKSPENFGYILMFSLLLLQLQNRRRYAS